MDTKANYTAIGIFVILLSAAAVTFFVWLAGVPQRQAFNTYLVYASGGVDGLASDSPVLFNGVRVGMINNIVLDKNNPQLVKIFLRVDTKIAVTESTVATLVPQGITGIVYMGLKSESPEAPLLKAEQGQPYPVIPYKKPLLIQLTEVLPALAKDMGDIAEKFKKLMSGPNLANLSDSLANLAKVTDTLNKQSDNIRQSLTSLNVAMKNTAAASQYFKGTLLSAQQAAKQLNKTTDQIGQEVSNLSQQTLPSVQELLSKMNDTTANLQQLTEDLQTNPSILLRGKQQPAPGPGE